MDTMEQAYRPLTLPMHQNETSLMRVRPEGLLSASPLRFQPGLVKVPEGIHHPLLETSTQQLSGRYRQTFIAVHEAASFWYPPRLRLPVRFPVADEMAQEEQRKARSVWAMLGYTVGAGAVVMLYALIPAVHRPGPCRRGWFVSVSSGSTRSSLGLGTIWPQLAHSRRYNAGSNSLLC